MWLGEPPPPAHGLKRVPGQVNSAGSLATIFFTNQPVRNYEGARESDARRFAVFFSEMLDRGIFLPPSQFEALFLSAAHTESDRPDGCRLPGEPEGSPAATLGGLECLPDRLRACR